jgi:hypothetical protein
MIVSPPIAIVYMGSYYTMNMIHDIWVFTILIMNIFIECENKSKTKMGASTLASWSSNFMDLKSYFIFFFVTLIMWRFLFDETYKFIKGWRLDGVPLPYATG